MALDLTFQIRCGLVGKKYYGVGLQLDPKIILCTTNMCIFKFAFKEKLFEQARHLNCGTTPHSYFKCFCKLYLRHIPL